MIERFLAQLRGSVRLRIGLALLLGIVWLNGLLDARDGLDAMRQNLQHDVSTLARQQAESGQGAWKDRAAQAKSRREALEQRLWDDKTPALADAELRDWLTSQLAQAGIDKGTVTVNAAQSASDSVTGDVPPGIRRRVAKLSFTFEPNSLEALLAQLSSSGHMTAVLSLSVRRFPGPQVEMIVAAYQRIGAIEDKSGAPS